MQKYPSGNLGDALLLATDFVQVHTMFFKVHPYSSFTPSYKHNLAVVPSKSRPDSRSKWSKSVPVFRAKWNKNPTLWGCIYLYVLYKGVPHGTSH